MRVLIKRHDPDLPMPTQHGDWIDLYAAKTMFISGNSYAEIPLGISVKLPEHCEAIVVPRSSTFKNFGILLANSVGVIDNTYCGENDQWRFPAYAVRDTDVHKGDRICQFRIFENQPQLHFVEVAEMSDTDRGGIGSTGVK